MSDPNQPSEFVRPVGPPPRIPHGGIGALRAQQPVSLRVDVSVRSELPNPPKGGSGISRPQGAFAQSVAHIPIVTIHRQCGLHAVLCWFGLHCWETRMPQMVGSRLLDTERRCSVCGVRRG